MAAGAKTKPQFWADDASSVRRFRPDPLSTSKARNPLSPARVFLVQVPYRNIYWMETVGNAPSVRFEVVHSNRTRSIRRRRAIPAGAGRKRQDLHPGKLPHWPDPYTDKNMPYWISGVIRETSAVAGRPCLCLRHHQLHECDPRPWQPTPPTATRAISTS